MPDMSWNKSAPLNRHELFLAETTAWLGNQAGLSIARRCVPRLGHVRGAARPEERGHGPSSSPQ